ncbi:hypothetical protein RRG08_007556, partial [Elysia crispata]
MASASLQYLVFWLITIGLDRTAQGKASCPSGWIESTQSGTCIKVYEDKKSWEDARAVCQAAGGDLVKIIDDSMNQFIW